MSGKKQSQFFMEKLLERNLNDNPSKRPEVREKLRLAKLGRKRGSMPIETRLKISRSTKGRVPSRVRESHPNWKGGVTTHMKLLRQKFRETMQPTILERDDYTCQLCSERGGYLQVDHIKGWASHPELRFEPSNCRTLCMACHYRVTFGKELPEGIIWGHSFVLSRSKNV